jgi:nucleotide-binding universal stress UspA family protein
VNWLRTSARFAETFEVGGLIATFAVVWKVDDVLVSHSKGFNRMNNEHNRHDGYQKILVAIDFSPHSDAALNQAVWLARKSGAKVALAHSIPDIREALCGTSYEGRLDFLYGEGNAFQREIRRHSDAGMQKKIMSLRAVDLDITFEALLGAPFVEIIHAVQQEGHDLVLAGTRGKAAWTESFIGSTAKRLIRKCPASVWIVKGEHTEPPKVVLAATDFSEVSFKAAMQGLWIARQSGAAFHVLHVIDPTDIPEALISVIPDGGTLEVERKENARKRLDAFVESLPSDHARIQAHLVSGVSSKEVGRIAEQLNADLIAIGTVGRNGIKRLLLGNTAEKVLSTCDCSILTVKPDGFVSPIDPPVWPLHPDSGK